ncbi:MAG: LysM peptidoglycan-binding domain-containing protein [Flavobacteriales bacterium]|nr:LysM peptidoglycan-binding domain-containing protein [Flavobacteriales bacterium]
MKLLFYITFVCFFSMGCGSVTQQQYKTHTVQKGETVFSIAKRYGVTKEVIYKLNPDAKSGVQTNAVLILPNKTMVDLDNSEIRFKQHRVKRRETLFSISQLYNVSQDDIKKYNKELYSRQLKKGEKIMIPQRIANTGSASTGGSTTSETETETTENTHTVEAKETKYGIARKYGITIAELEALNPKMGESLQIGTVLRVPETSVTDTAMIEDERFAFYEVQPKEGFYRLEVKLGLSEEEIVRLNPYAKDGLKDGMILKIPKESAEIVASGTAEIVDLTNRITNRSKKKIALMLPFQLKETVSDSIDANSEVIKKNSGMRVALDFYSGVLMATEFAKDKGISVELDVYDTEGSVSKTANIISQNNFKEIDAVIGPLLSKNVEKAASELRSSDTPVFSPLSNKNIKLYSNLFQTLPTDEMLQATMLDYLKQNESSKNYILVSDETRNAQRQAILSEMPDTKTVSLRKGAFLYVGDIDSKIDKTRENWIILESTNPVLVSNVVGLLNGLPANYKVRLLTLDKNDAYDYHDVSNVHLANLNFTFPSVNKSYDFNDKNAFLVSYKNEYGVLPNRYAVRGFDVAYDVLLRLASADDVYKATDSDYETEYIENKFRYSKKLFSGYQNQAVYLIKFNKDLQFEEVK